MTVTLTVTELAKGPSLKLVFSIISDDESGPEAVSQNFNVCDLAVVKFKYEIKIVNNIYNLRYLCSYSFKKHQSAKDYTVKLNILCESKGYSKQFICTENWADWINIDNEISMKCNTVTHYDIAMSVIKLESKSFANLYDETDFCDFHLSTADGSGSVAVHKVCLITHSDTFKRMLSSNWKETEEGCIEIKEVTLQTLQNLKKYIYLGILPDTEDDVYQLLLLARCYLIKNLKEECVAKLAREVKPENLQKLQEFAIDHKLPELISAITYFTPEKIIKTAHKIQVDKQASSENDGK